METARNMDAAMTDEQTGTKLKWLWLTVAVIALDLGTKALATAMLTFGDPVPVVPLFNLTLLHNTGAAFRSLWLAAVVLCRAGGSGQCCADRLAEGTEAGRNLDGRGYRPDPRWRYRQRL